MIDFADEELVTFELDRMHDGKEAATVLLDFRPLVTVQRILDRELVQVECHPHLFELLGHQPSRRARGVLG